MTYPYYSIHRQSQGGYVICACGHMNCAVTAYVEPADRAYRYDGACAHYPEAGHTRPGEVPLEEAMRWASPPAPERGLNEAQWTTTCPDCGVADQMNVYSGTFLAAGMPLDAAGGFSFLDAQQVNTEDERVQCMACGSEWDLGFLTL